VSEALSNLLNTINCLPGIGTLTVVVNSIRVLQENLPLKDGYVTPELRTVLTQGMLIGGGIEINLTISQRTQVFGVCLGGGRWSGCTEKQVKKGLAIDANEIAAGFPALGTVERISQFSGRAAT
jgi:hypothetical protein